MKRQLETILLGLLLLCVFSAPAMADRDILKVMTRNQYLGADLTPLILAQSENDFKAAAMEALQQIAANNFPLRAQRLATEVAITKPDLIGLQEVYDFTLNGENVGPPFVNHLDEMLAALDDNSQSYEVAATLNNLDITVSIEGLGLLRVLDRDVILARENVDYTPLGGDFTTGGLCGVPIPNPVPIPPFPDSLQSITSEDGCNYTAVAQAPSQIGTIIIERGFVAIDATVRGKTYRFVNTHLEQRQPDPTEPGSAIFQSLQAVELVGTLLATTPPDMDLILLGDFNSGSEDFPIAGITPPYQIIDSAGFTDVWGKNLLAGFDPDGFTCCEDPDLSNPNSVQYERVDIIFTKNNVFHTLAFVTGRVPIFPLGHPPNWASDHGGVFGRLIFKNESLD